MDVFIEQSSVGTKIFCCGGTCLVLIVTTLIMMAVSTIEPTEHAILYNKLTKTLYDETYTGGMYYAGVTSSFVKFPANQKTIEFSSERNADVMPLATRTKEGLLLQLHFSFQYQIDPKGLKSLYALTGEKGYKTLYERLAGDIILKEAGNFAASEYWLKRTEIGNKMRDSLNTALGVAHAKVTNFQFLNIDLPDTYENAIVLTQIENQKAQTSSYNREIDLIKAQITVDQSDAEMKTTVINAGAQAEALKAKNNAEADIRAVTIMNQKEAWANTKTTIGFQTSAELLEYIYLKNLNNLETKATLVYGIQDPTFRYTTTI